MHGGAFLAGAGSLPHYCGDRLTARGDMVVVTVNYRLGMFGYLRGIDRCGDALPSTGNEGLQDQLAALRWVKHEIAAFGSNPENVTVAGQSAGAVSISVMLAMPDASGLFHKTVLQSGAANLAQQPAANKVMALMLADRGLAPGEAAPRRDLPAAEILDMQTRPTPRSRGAVYRPMADGVNILANQRAVGVQHPTGNGLTTSDVRTAMETDARADIVQAWIAAWVGPDRATLEALAAPAYVHHSARDGTLESFMQGLAMVNRTFAGYHVAVDQVVADGAHVAVRWTGGGTFREPFFGIAATQQPALMRGMTFFHVEGGKIQADWETLDMLGFRLRLQA